MGRSCRSTRAPTGWAGVWTTTSASPATRSSPGGMPRAALVQEDGTELPRYEGSNRLCGRLDNDVCLTGGPFVAGRHAEVRVEAGQFSLTDLGSTNGTFIDGERLLPGDTRPLADG